MMGVVVAAAVDVVAVVAVVALVVGAEDVVNVEDVRDVEDVEGVDGVGGADGVECVEGVEVVADVEMSDVIGLQAVGAVVVFVTAIAELVAHEIEKYVSEEDSVLVVVDSDVAFAVGLDDEFLGSPLSQGKRHVCLPIQV